MCGRLYCFFNDEKKNSFRAFSIAVLVLRECSLNFEKNQSFTRANIEGIDQHREENLAFGLFHDFRRYKLP